MALIHHQFESIHPFPDGNDRVGQILNVLYLTRTGLLDISFVYLSRYITRYKDEYYRLLQKVRDEGAWEAWILYMLRAVFEETASGGRWDRPKLQEMIGQLRDGDVVVVWKLDRAVAQSQGSIDITTAAGRMMMQMVGSFAEFERAMIRERTSTGLAQARAEGRIGGRRRYDCLYRVSEPTVSRIVAAYRQASLANRESMSQ